jgi:hypothetical protein
MGPPESNVGCGRCVPESEAALTRPVRFPRTSGGQDNFEANQYSPAGQAQVRPAFLDGLVRPLLLEARRSRGDAVDSLRAESRPARLCQPVTTVRQTGGVLSEHASAPTRSADVLIWAWTLWDRSANGNSRG